MVRTLVALAVSVLLWSAAVAPASAGVPPPTDGSGAVTEQVPTGPAANDFVPDDVNLGDCLSSLPRPGCGSENRSGLHQYLVFGALVAGTAFIGWRIARSVRRRDAGAPG